MNQSLSGRNIALLATDGVEQIQLAWPWEAMLDAGANVELVAPNGNGVQGFNHREPGFVFPVDKPLREALARDYDALVLPGGAGCSEALGADAGALRFLREFRTLAKPVAAICQAPYVLARADVVRRRRLTSWPGIRPAIRRAGGTWIDQEVVVDGGLITCRAAGDLDALCDALINELLAALRESDGGDPLRRREPAGHTGERYGYQASERSRFS